MKILFAVACSLFFLSCSPNAIKEPAEFTNTPHPKTWLPNGHFLTPAGTSVEVGSLPLGMSLSPDKKNIIVVNSGYGDQTLSLINVAKQSVVQTLQIRKSWMGSVWGALGDYFFATGGNDNKVYRYGFAKDSAWFLNSIKLGDPAPAEFISPAGLDINTDGNTIYTVSRISNELFKLNAYDNSVEQKLQFNNPLYTCLLDESRQLIYVSEWGAQKITVVQSNTLSRMKEIPVGSHPCAMVMNQAGTHLFVSNSGENTVSVVNLSTFTVDETIDVGLKPNAPIGSTPNAISISGDTLLIVALADNNALAMVDIRSPRRSNVKGFIPTAWYPTAVLTADTMIAVANARGNSSYANAHYSNTLEYERGSVHFIRIPDERQLHEYTQKVFDNNPFTRLKQYADWSENNPVPLNGQRTSPIKYVFYIIKEMRSYDQMFGDIGRGNGEDSLVMYGKDVAPNHRSLAEEFVLLDNFYANGQTAPDGMNYAVSAYANDYIKKTWPTLYARRGGTYDYEQDGMATSSSGYLWDAAQKKGLRIRNYGMFVDEAASARGEIIPLASGLARTTSPIYRGWDINYFDTLRAEMWMKEFDLYVQGDSLPHLSFIRLPNDNTAGDRKNFRTRKSYIADNDRALGKIVERITASKYWNASAIFILETSANGGPDHKDAHRTVGLVVSPYVKRKFVDTTHYTTTSIVNTIERILGIPFMTQHDAGATPMYKMFQPLSDTTQYQSQLPRYPLNEFAR